MRPTAMPPRPIAILGIPGSVHPGACSRAALQAARDLLPAGATLEIFDLDGMPPFNRDMNARPFAKLAELRQRVRAADALLFAVPEALQGLLAVLNNALDASAWPCGDNAWAGKAAAVIGVCEAGQADGRAQRGLRDSLLALDMRPVAQPPVLIRNASHAFDGAGRLLGAAHRAQVRLLLDHLVDTLHASVAVPVTGLPT